MAKRYHTAAAVRGATMSSTGRLTFTGSLFAPGEWDEWMQEDDVVRTEVLPRHPSNPKGWVGLRVIDSCGTYHHYLAKGVKMQEVQDVVQN